MNRYLGLIGAVVVVLAGGVMSATHLVLAASAPGGGFAYTFTDVAPGDVLTSPLSITAPASGGALDLAVTDLDGDAALAAVVTITVAVPPGAQWTGTIADIEHDRPRFVVPAATTVVAQVSAGLPLAAGNQSAGRRLSFALTLTGAEVATGGSTAGSTGSAGGSTANSTGGSGPGSGATSVLGSASDSNPDSTPGSNRGSSLVSGTGSHGPVIGARPLTARVSPLVALASTGLAVGAWLATGAALVAIGAALVMGSRRREPRAWPRSIR